jgi:hypothetical protein
MEKVRVRWGVQMDFRDRGAATARWRTLGAGWIEPIGTLPTHVDFWPASYPTRREARAAVTTLLEKAKRHSPQWKFRAVRLEITVRAGS